MMVCKACCSLVEAADGLYEPAHSCVDEHGMRDDSEAMGVGLENENDEDKGGVEDDECPKCVDDLDEDSDGSAKYSFVGC